MPRDLLFEIGVEEIPSAPLYDAIAQLKLDAGKRLQSMRLPHVAVASYGAPRRLVLFIVGLAEEQQSVDSRVKGPAVKVAFDADGNATKAAEGFARGQGVEVADLVRDTENGGEYVFAVKRLVGGATAALLPEMLADLASGLNWPKAQRWGDGDARFIRPVRWMVALFGDEVVPVEFAGLTAGRTTYGHRFLSPGAIEVASATGYYAAAETGRFIFDHEERARIVEEGVEEVARAAGGTAVMPAKTRAEVINLVECPTVAAGHFDEEFLAVPREVLETAMESHQRYFPVENASGALTNAFVVVHNGDPERTGAIVAGHERVIRARLADAAFFYQEDLKASMEEWFGRLEQITFQEKLGSLEAKVERVERLTARLAALGGMEADVEAEAVRAAHLCKTDLVSHAVVEFPSLQGLMGRYYALAAGEQPRVAQAILEHYQPRYAGDTLPSSEPGMLVSAADKLDTMCGIFAIGQAPTGSADPYALRRGAIGVLSMMIDGGLKLPVSRAIVAAVQGYQGVVSGMHAQEVGDAVVSFVGSRLEGMLRERGHAYDIVAAVLAVAFDDPADALTRCAALTEFRSTDAGRDLLVAFKRAANLADASVGAEPDAAMLGPEELALVDALSRAEGEVRALVRDRMYADALAALAELRAPVDTFFDAVLVMDADERLRTNRLKILNRVVDLFAGFADLALLEG